MHLLEQQSSPNANSLSLATAPMLHCSHVTLFPAKVMCACRFLHKRKVGGTVWSTGATMNRGIGATFMLAFYNCGACAQLRVKLLRIN